MRRVPSRHGMHLPQLSRLDELHEELGDVHHAGRLVHDDQAAGAHDRADRSSATRSRSRCRGAASGMQPPEGPPICTALHCLPFGDAAADVEDDLAAACVPIGDLDQAGARRPCPTARRPSCPCSSPCPWRRTTSAPVVDDAGQVGQRLDVVDDRRLAEQAAAPPGTAAGAAACRACPSMLWISAVSSPQTNAPAPILMTMSRLKPLSRMLCPSRP